MPFKIENCLLYMYSSNEIYAQEKKILPTAECFRMIQQRKQIIRSEEKNVHI